MKILSGPEGDGLLTNVEVQAWLKEKNFEIHRRELTEDQIRPPDSVASLARDLREYLESSPSGNETVDSVRKLFTQLEKYKLSPPELMMIANIRPEAYAHLTPLIVDVYSRFDEDTLYEMLEIINNTLEKRKKPEQGTEAGEQNESSAQDKQVEVDAEEEPQTGEQTTAEQTTAEQTTAEQTTVEQTTVEQMTVEQTTVEQTTVEQPTVEQPMAEQPTSEQPTLERPVVEQPTVEPAKVEQPMVEQPTVQVKAEPGTSNGAAEA